MNKRNWPYHLLDTALSAVDRVRHYAPPPIDDAREYQRGYRAGLAAEHRISTEDIIRMGNLWLAKTDHPAHCSCRGCSIARKAARIEILNIVTKGDVCK